MFKDFLYSLEAEWKFQELAIANVKYPQLEEYLFNSVKARVPRHATIKMTQKITQNPLLLIIYFNSTDTFQLVPGYKTINFFIKS